jgi:hypothetical protein
MVPSQHPDCNGGIYTNGGAYSDFYGKSQSPDLHYSSPVLIVFRVAGDPESAVFLGEKLSSWYFNGNRRSVIKMKSVLSDPRKTFVKERLRCALLY